MSIFRIQKPLILKALYEIHENGQVLTTLLACATLCFVSLTLIHLVNHGNQVRHKMAKIVAISAGVTAGSAIITQLADALLNLKKKAQDPQDGIFHEL